MHSKPKLKLEKSLAMFEEAQRVSPGGVMGIRRPYNFVEGEYPIFLTHGYGGHIDRPLGALHSFRGAFAQAAYSF